MRFRLISTSNMTFSANRNHIKPMFWLIAFMMMIELCALGTITADKRIWLWQLKSSDGFINSSFSFSAFRVLLIVFIVAFFTLFTFIITTINFFHNLFTIGVLNILFNFGSALLASGIFSLIKSHTIFTPIVMTIFTFFIFTKLRNRLLSFADAASF